MTVFKGSHDDFRDGSIPVHEISSRLSAEIGVALIFASREAEGIAIVDLKERLTQGQEDLLFRSLIDQAVAAGKIRMVLNLDRVNYIDTAGLGSLMFALAKLRRAGGGLALFNLHPAHMEVVLFAKMEGVLGTFGTQQDAINSFFPDRQVRHYDILEFVTSARPQDGRSQRVLSGR